MLTGLDLGENMSVRTFDILIVDDDKTSRNVLEYRLRTLSFTRIDTAADGLEALRRLVLKHYDLVFLDNNMPNMSGLEFLRRCKEVSILNGTSVIMLTGSADDQTLRCVKDEGLKVDDFILKPLEADVLKAKVERLERNWASWSEVSRNIETGAFMSIRMDVSGSISKLKLFGVFHHDERHAIQDVPDRVCMAPTESIIIDLRDVMSIDEFGIGMLLLIHGVACMAKKLIYLLLDGKTIKTRLEALGIGKIMRVIEHEAEIISRPSGSLADTVG